MSERSDTDLVTGALAGDRDAFAAIYDRYADRLHDFCWSVLRDRDEAADAVQDTFVLAAQRLAQLNDPERLRPWLYAVARSVALRRVRVRRRIVLDEVGDMADTDPGPHRAAEQEALRELVWTAAGGLSERDRALLDLHLRQGLEGAELGEAMGVSASHAYVLLTRLRAQVERSLGALLIARLGREDCTELDALLSGWDGRFSPILRKRVARHVDQCEVCAERRRIVVSPWALLGAVPLLPAPLWLKDRVLNQVQLASMEIPTETAVTPPVLAVASKRARATAAAAAVLALLVAVSAVVYWRNSDAVDGKPLALENSVPSTTSRTTTSRTTLAPVPPPTTGRTTTTPARTTTTAGLVQPPPPPPPPPPTTTTTPPPDTTGPTFGEQSVGDLNASFCGEPTTTFVTVPITDPSGVRGADLTWFGPDERSGTLQMEQVDGVWQARIGPFRAAGGASWTITAVDNAGNTSTTKGETSVGDCPIR